MGGIQREGGEEGGETCVLFDVWNGKLVFSAFVARKTATSATVMASVIFVKILK